MAADPAYATLLSGLRVAARAAAARIPQPRIEAEDFARRRDAFGPV